MMSKICIEKLCERHNLDILDPIHFFSHNFPHFVSFLFFSFFFRSFPSQLPAARNIIFDRSSFCYKKIYIAIHCPAICLRRKDFNIQSTSSDNDWEVVHARNVMELVQLQLWPHVVRSYARQHWNHCDRRRCNRRYALNRLVQLMNIVLWQHHRHVLRPAI